MTDAGNTTGGVILAVILGAVLIFLLPNILQYFSTLTYSRLTPTAALLPTAAPTLERQLAMAAVDVPGRAPTPTNSPAPTSIPTPEAITFDGAACISWDEIQFTQNAAPKLCVYGNPQRIIVKEHRTPDSEYRSSAEIIFSAGGEWQVGDFRLFVNHNDLPEYIQVGRCIKALGILGRLSLSPIIVTYPGKVKPCEER